MGKALVVFFPVSQSSVAPELLTGLRVSNLPTLTGHTTTCQEREEEGGQGCLTAIGLCMLALEASGSPCAIACCRDSVDWRELA